MANKCNFCGSDEVLKETPYVELTSWDSDGPVYEKKKTFCCKAQKQNNVYLSKFSPGNEPDMEDVEKW